MLQIQHGQWSVFAMSAILNFMHLVCALLDIALFHDFFSRLEVFGCGSVASLSSIHIVQTKELHLLKYISSLSSFLKALAVHGVILDWLLALYVHRVRNLFLGFRFDEAFFKQSFQPLFFLQIKGFSCF